MDAEVVDGSLLHERAAGMDVSKTDVKVAVRVVGAGRSRPEISVTTWDATVGSILRLAEHLRAAAVTVVVMEATGDYWKPFYFLLEAEGVPVMLVNAKQAKNIPGKKTDVLDAVWLAHLAGQGMLRPSFVPPEPIRDLRDLTRGRKHAVGDQVRVVQRLEKFLESTGLKLSSVVSDITGVSATAMLRALVAGERDPERLASMARGRMKSKHAELVEALRVWRFTDHAAFMVETLLDQIEQANLLTAKYDARIEDAMAPFRHVRDALTTITGVSTDSANVIIAEIGVEMSVFPTASHLASWAGICPGNNVSAGRVKSARISPGNRYLKGALGTAAKQAIKDPDTFLGHKYRAVKSRQGHAKAFVAAEHSMLIGIWHMIARGEAWNENGFEHARRPDTEQRQITRAIRLLASHGIPVDLPTVAA